MGYFSPFRSLLSVSLSYALLFTPLVDAISVSSTILVFAPNSYSAYSVTSGLSGYGIPFETVQANGSMPVLNSTISEGNYGGIIVMSEAVPTTQWQQIYDYQTAFGVRMVRLNVYPSSDSGTTTAVPGAGCCDAGVEQLISISNSTSFPTANLVTGATMSTQGLWHYPASIIDPSTTIEIAQFAPAGIFSMTTTAAVINSFPEGRQQMVWFMSYDTTWSATSSFLQHAHINWVTRGLFIGRRRVVLSTQVDDMLLPTALYQPAGQTFRLRSADMTAHAAWIQDLNSRLPAGSEYFTEIGFNGNGDILASVQTPGSVCVPMSAIIFTSDPPTTDLEYQKPLGAGSDIWPSTPTTYPWNLPCASVDDLAAWFMVPSNRDNFAHISHTFSHESLDAATYSDANKEIQFNQAWLNQVGLAGAKRFSPNGLIPPSITGLHNGDCLQAWSDNGINNAVGDNTRPVLMNQQDEFWPLNTTIEENGFAGITIVPRWATTIYYNCDLANCTTAEWIATSGGSGDFNSLLKDARAVNTKHLLGLRHDAFMFHQANLRQGDVPVFTVGNQSGQLSLLQIWVETITQEMTRLTTWPIISLKQDDLAADFLNRMTRDRCEPRMSYTYSSDGTAITAVSITSNNGNSCAAPIPITFPVNVCTGTVGTIPEQIGSDPLTVWTPLNGLPVTFTLSKPVPVWG